jgi:DNA-binding NarL/FixJ family response regulator
LRIAVIDDHPLYLGALTEHVSRFFRDASVSAFHLFHPMLQAHTDKKFDLIILDYNLQDISGSDALRTITTTDERVPVVFVSGSATRKQILQSIEEGAKGFITKTVDESLLCAALQLVMNGGTYVPQEAFAAPQSEASAIHLTERDRVILQMISKGCSNKEIARELKLSEATIKFHLSHLFQRLGVKNRVQAAALVHD